MKTFLTAVTALGLAAVVPQAAHAMDCCKDGKCECCKKDDEAPKPAPEGSHQH